MRHDHCSFDVKRRGLIRAAGFTALLVLAACGPALSPDQPITSLDQVADCWTDFDDPLRQVLCFGRGTDVVGVERGDGLGNIICSAEGEAAILGNRLVVVQETLPGGCLDGAPFVGQFVECDLTISTVFGMFCKRRLGDDVDDPTAGEQYILTRL